MVRVEVTPLYSSAFFVGLTERIIALYINLLSSSVIYAYINEGKAIFTGFHLSDPF